MAINCPHGPIGMVFRVTILPFGRAQKNRDHPCPNLFLDKHHFFQQTILCLLDTIGIYSRKNTPPKISMEPKVMVIQNVSLSNMTILGICVKFQGVQ